MVQRLCSVPQDRSTDRRQRHGRRQAAPEDRQRACVRSKRGICSCGRPHMTLPGSTRNGCCAGPCGSSPSVVVDRLRRLLLPLPGLPPLRGGSLFATVAESVMSPRAPLSAGASVLPAFLAATRRACLCMRYAHLYEPVSRPRSSPPLSLSTCLYDVLVRCTSYYMYDNMCVYTFCTMYYTNPFNTSYLVPGTLYIVLVQKTYYVHHTRYVVAATLYHE